MVWVGGEICKGVVNAPLAKAFPPQAYQEGKESTGDSDHRLLAMEESRWPVSPLARSIDHRIRWSSGLLDLRGLNHRHGLSAFLLV